MSGGGGFGGGFSNMSDIFEQHGDIFGDIFEAYLEGKILEEESQEAVT